MTKKIIKVIKVVEFELDPLIELMEVTSKGRLNNEQCFQGIPYDSKKRAKQKEGIISQKENYQIIKKNGRYYGKIKDIYKK